MHTPSSVSVTRFITCLQIVSADCVSAERDKSARDSLEVECVGNHETKLLLNCHLTHNPLGIQVLQQAIHHNTVGF